MTSQEQIAYLRACMDGVYKCPERLPILAVCDLAERALLTDDETEAVRRWLAVFNRTTIAPVLRRLLGEPPA